MKINISIKSAASLFLFFFLSLWIATANAAMVADYGSGNTDNKAEFDALVAATPDGGVLTIPNGNYYFASSPAPIEKYITIQMEGLSGYASGALWFDNCSGLDVEKGYVTIKNIGLWGTVNPSASPLTTAGAGNVGLRVGNSYASSVHLDLQNVQIGYFNTGLYLGANNAVYTRVRNLDVFYNNTGIGASGMATDSTWSQVHVRNSHVHGLYAHASYFRFEQSLFENNGTAPSDLNNDTNANYYGLSIVNNSHVDLGDGYMEQNSTYVDDTSSLRINELTWGGGIAIFGGGKVLIKDDYTSENLVPFDVLRDWTVTTATITESTSGGLSYGVISTSATGCNVYYDIQLPRNLMPQDITGALLSYDVKITTGAAATGFTVTPSIIFHQPSGRQDAVGNARWFKDSAFNWGDAQYHRQSFYIQPRYGASYLDAAEYGMDYIRVMLQITGDFSGAPSLSALLRNVSFKLYTNKSISFPNYREGSWTPVDGSGAGLSFSTTEGWYTKVGRMVTGSFAVTYPATTNGLDATISGLPFTAKNTTAMFGGFLTYNNSSMYFAPQIINNTKTIIFRTTNGASLINSQLSGKIVRGVIVYIQ